jgi:hypothetical protein
LTGPDFHRLDFFEWFHRLISDPPLPRFSQRDALDFQRSQASGWMIDPGTTTAGTAPSNCERMPGGFDALLLPVLYAEIGRTAPRVRLLISNIRSHADRQELRVLDEFRFESRMPSRAAAIRELLKRGLAAGGDSAPARVRSKAKAGC